MILTHTRMHGYSTAVVSEYEPLEVSGSAGLHSRVHQTLSSRHAMEEELLRDRQRKQFRQYSLPIPIQGSRPGFGSRPLTPL
jgi:hypothetical protein